MGMVAFVRQTLLDAQHSRAEVEHARRTKAAAPAVDPGLEALQPALAGQTPVAIEANLAREIGRALALAKEFGLDPIIVGGLEADQAAADLKAHGARVIYSLSYPERPKSLAPDADEPLRVLRERTNAPRVPSVLAASGVVFAFESSGLKEPKQFLTNAAKAVKAGLPPEAAVRALTIDAARVAGVADQIGSIEKGKIANVIVAEGDLFSPAMAIRRVFIGGRPVGPGLSRSRSNR
jgi:imidazolonepropionase-like amidohydrolase